MLMYEPLSSLSTVLSKYQILSGASNGTVHLIVLLEALAKLLRYAESVVITPSM